MMKAIKKFSVFMITTFLLFGMISCGDSAQNSSLIQVDDYKQYLGETFNSVVDLSSRQGYRNWYYYCGDPEDQLSYMTFNSYYGRWCSKYNTLYADTFMWGNSWLPDNNAGAGVGMGFKAPATGTVEVNATVKLLSPEQYNSGDGVLFVVSDKSGELYSSIFITPKDGGIDKTICETIEVSIGEEILFMLYGNLNNVNDATDVNISISYT